MYGHHVETISKTLVAAMLFISTGTAFASGIGGVSGYDTFDYSQWNNMTLDDWPQEYRDLCLQHMRATIKKCSELGYDNWSVSRDFSGRTFAPSDGKFGSSDWVIGANTCDDGANTIDEVRIFNVSLVFMCSENNFCGNIHSDQYFCQFSCQAYNCDEDDDPYEVYACSTAGSPDPSKDAWDQITEGCREQTEQLCSSRGQGCQLERPCYFKNKYGEVADDAFCKCTCPYEPFDRTITDEQLRDAQSETFGIDSFNFGDWERQNKTACWGKTKVVEETKKGRSIIGRVGNTVKGTVSAIGNFFGSIGSKAKNLISRSKLPFSENAGTVIAESVTGRPRTNENIRAALMENNACNPTPDQTGTGTGDDTGSGPKREDFVIIGSQTNDIVNSTQSTIGLVATGFVDAQPPKPPTNLVTPTTPAESKCAEDWSCNEWTKWSDWSRCDPTKENDLQYRTKTRQCRDKNSCNTFENKPKTSEMEKKTCNDTANDDTNTIIDANATCTENWSCGNFGNWSACSGGTQSRTRNCTDANNCGTTANRSPLSESRNSCADTVQCTESWSCGEWSAGAWGACQEGTRTRTLSRTCTDSNSCGTTSSKPGTTNTESEPCDYTPTEEKPEYSSHVSSLGSRIGTLSYVNGSVQFNTSTSSGEYGYKVLNIPSHATIKICVQVSSGSLGYNSYPQYHYGYDWSTQEWEAANPGCITAYNKNAWANGMLIHLGSPSPSNAAGTLTVAQIS